LDEKEEWAKRNPFSILPIFLNIPFRLAGSHFLCLNKVMKENASKEQTLSKAINLGSENLLPWPFLVFLVVP
jgi:hypothetical protein